MISCNRRRSLILTVNFITLIMIALSVYFRNLVILDEVWLYAYGKNMADGLLPYRDMNICTTPLAFWILAGSLKIFGNSLLVFRAMTILVYGCCYILGSRRIAKHTTRLFPQLGYAAFFLSLYQIFLYEYNILNCLFIMVLICLENKESRWDTGREFLQGAIIGTILLTKQTTGLVAMICYLLVFFLKKKRVKEGMAGAAGCLLVTGAFGIYLISNGLVPAFWEYTVLGVKNFTVNMNFSSILKTFFMHPYIPILLSYLAYQCAKSFLYCLKEPSENIQKKSAASIYMLIPLSVAYPLFDHTHFALGLLLVVPEAMIRLQSLLDQKPQYRTVTRMAIIILVAWEILSYKPVLYGNSIKSTIPQYKGIYISADKETTMKKVMAAVAEYQDKGYEVYILDAEATVYLTPMDIYHKDYDMMFNGNTGNVTTAELVRKICTSGSAIFYVKVGGLYNYQMPEGIMENLTANNMICIDECEKFDVYMMSDRN